MAKTAKQNFHPVRDLTSAQTTTTLSDFLSAAFDAHGIELGNELDVIVNVIATDGALEEVFCELLKRARGR